MAERLHKVLAQHGLGSRREIERWIVEGRIALNGRIAKTGDAWNDGDKVQLDGRDVTRQLERKVAAQVLAYHKPQGQLIAAQDARDNLTGDTEAPPAAVSESRREVFTETVHDRLPKLRGSRWLPINPMHAGDSGLLLLTNDGALSYALTRQKKWIPTSYMVRVQVRGGLANAPALPTSVTMDDGEVTFTDVTVVGDPLDAEGESVSASGNVWYRVDMPRADKRAAVRALFVSHHLSISRMTQVAFGPVSLTKEMPRGRQVVLDDKQLERLYALAKLPLPVQPGVMTGKFSGKPLNRNRPPSAGAATRGNTPTGATKRRADDEATERRAPRTRGSNLRGSKQPSRADQADSSSNRRPATRSGARSKDRSPDRSSERSPQRSPERSTGRSASNSASRSQTNSPGHPKERTRHRPQGSRPSSRRS